MTSVISTLTELSHSKQFQDHVSELEEQLHVLSAQRDSQALEISKYKQQLEHNSLAMINLQSALEQIQKGKSSALTL